MPKRMQSDFDRLSEEIKKEIKEEEPKILQWLSEHGYTIISIDRRMFFYSYTIIKGNKIETKKNFSFYEMKKICGLIID